MAHKANILYAMQQSRLMLEGMIAKMKSDTDWMYQAHPSANHPLWVVGHVALADNMFAALIDENLKKLPEGWEEVFWFGSEISGDRSKYPPTEEVLAYARDRREVLVKAIEAASEEYFEGPTPEEGMFAEAPNMAGIFYFVAYHEGLHTGQFSIANRGLGNDPLFTPS